MERKINGGKRLSHKDKSDKTPNNNGEEHHNLKTPAKKIKIGYGLDDSLGQIIDPDSIGEKGIVILRKQHELSDKEKREIEIELHKIADKNKIVLHGKGLDYFALLISKSNQIAIKELFALSEIYAWDPNISGTNPGGTISLGTKESRYTDKTKKEKRTGYIVRQEIFLIFHDSFSVTISSATTGISSSLNVGSLFVLSIQILTFAVVASRTFVATFRLPSRSSSPQKSATSCAPRGRFPSSFLKSSVSKSLVSYASFGSLFPSCRYHSKNSRTTASGSDICLLSLAPILPSAIAASFSKTSLLLKRY